MVEKKTVRRAKELATVLKIFRDDGFVKLDDRKEFDDLNLVDIYKSQELFHTSIKKCADGSCFSVELFSLVFREKPLQIAVLNTWKPNAIMQTGMKFMCKEIAE